MAKKTYTPEQIINKLRQAEVHLSQGDGIGEASRKIGVTEQTYYRWRKEYGGMRVEQARRLKELEKEDARLKKLVADLSLDNSILKEAARGKLLSPPKRRKLIVYITQSLSASQRRACRVLEQPRATQRKPSRTNTEEERLTARIYSRTGN
jgi:putative transposase